MEELVRDAEASVTGRMVDGTIDHPRLKATLAEIDAGAYASQIALVRGSLSGSGDLPLRDALLASLCRAVTEAGVPVAMMQIVAMAFYRSTWMLMRRVDPAITLDGIRAYETWRALAIMDGFAFGRHGRMPVPVEAQRSCVERLRRTLLPAAAATGWEGPALPDGPVIVTPDASEDPAATALRNGFFRNVFIDYLAAGGDGHDHDLVIDVLEEALAHPERLPFLAGASPAQRAFRIAQLARTLVVLHDIACRLSVNAARIDAELRQAPITVQAATLAKAGVGATAGFDHLLVECLYASFPTLVAWVRATGPRLRIPRVIAANPVPQAAPQPPAQPQAAPKPAPRPVPQPVRRPGARLPGRTAGRQTGPPARQGGSSSSSLRPAIGPSVGISPFGWDPAPETRSVVRKPPNPVPQAQPAAKPSPQVKQPLPVQPPVARPQPPPAAEIDMDKADTEVINENI